MRCLPGAHRVMPPPPAPAHTHRERCCGSAAASLSLYTHTNLSLSRAAVVMMSPLLARPLASFFVVDTCCWVTVSPPLWVPRNIHIHVIHKAIGGHCHLVEWDSTLPTALVVAPRINSSPPAAPRHPFPHPTPMHQHQHAAPYRKRVCVCARAHGTHRAPPPPSSTSPTTAATHTATNCLVLVTGAPHDHVSVLHLQGTWPSPWSSSRRIRRLAPPTGRPPRPIPSVMPGTSYHQLLPHTPAASQGPSVHQVAPSPAWLQAEHHSHAAVRLPG